MLVRPDRPLPFVRRINLSKSEVKGLKPLIPRSELLLSVHIYRYIEEDATEILYDRPAA